MSESISTTDLAAATRVGQRLDSANDTLFQAYGLQESDDAKIKEMAIALGLTVKDATKSAKENGITVETIQMVAQRVFDRASSAYTALTNLLRSKKQSLDAVIQNIR